ncbi:Os08g0324800 [Oryza sativa Japonica Group]|uniref:Os08g0324800 protein n=1 Tax=Oryza sativa subsp. japonica TaxID=39947 RepID=A0A0P0XEF9_ORYSJ|nr:Os08g0324800 [Oryza sativa Japonica Group]
MVGKEDPSPSSLVFLSPSPPPFVGAAGMARRRGVGGRHPGGPTPSLSSSPPTMSLLASPLLGPYPSHPTSAASLAQSSGVGAWRLTEPTGTGWSQTSTAPQPTAS